MNPVEFEKVFETCTDLNWNYDFLSTCNYITWKIVRNNLNKPWNFKKISRNKIVKIEDVLDTPFLNWNWDELTLNDNMTFDVIKNNPRQLWNMETLEKKLTEKQLKEFYDIKYSFIDNNSIYSYDSYDNQNFIYEI
jgi:hypothetical protein